MFVYTIQPVVKPSNRFHNRFDNKLYRVNGALPLCQTANAWLGGAWIPCIYITNNYPLLPGLQTLLDTDLTIVISYADLRPYKNKKVKT